MKIKLLFVLVLLLSSVVVYSADQSINLVGCFNNWDLKSSSGAMIKNGDIWVTEIFLHIGNVEYKFAADNSWKINWGDDNHKTELPQNSHAKRSEGNIKASIQTSGNYVFAFDDKTGEYWLARSENQSEPVPSPQPPVTPPQSGVDFREESIYFLITTRFFDGDASNNFYNRDRIKKGDPHWRGDFKGLIQQLDYIKELGFTAIWITPPIENRSGLDYHGYHGYCCFAH